MDVYKNYLTKNRCYINPKMINPIRLMIHSTACKGVKAGNFLESWNTYKPGGRSVCVHGFIDETGIYQTLPFNYRAYHCGGTGNNNTLGFELCEPANYDDKEASMRIINNAVEYCAQLCQLFGLDPSYIISHKEGHKLGIASNHVDPDHWWSQIGYSMDQFRKDVEEAIKNTMFPDEREVVLSTSYGNESRWYLEDAGNGYVYIRNKATGKYLDSMWADNGTFFYARSLNKQYTQRFKIIHKPYIHADYIVIEPECAPGKYASVEGNGAAGSGKAHLKLWDDLHNPQQKFWAKVATDGSYLFVHTYSLLYISVVK